MLKCNIFLFGINELWIVSKIKLSLVVGLASFAFNAVLKRSDSHSGDWEPLEIRGVMLRGPRNLAFPSPPQPFSTPGQVGINKGRGILNHLSPFLLYSQKGLGKDTGWRKKEPETSSLQRIGQKLVPQQEYIQAGFLSIDGPAFEHPSAKWKVL